MTTFDDLNQRHQTLLDKLDETQNFISLSDKIFEFLDNIEKGSSEISSLREREQLQAFIRFWGATIYDNVGKYPNTKLRPSLVVEENNLEERHNKVIKNTQVKTVEQFEDDVTRLLEQEVPSPVVVKTLLAELTELINDQVEWWKLDYDNKNLTIELQAKLKEILKRVETSNSKEKRADLPELDGASSIVHDPRAEELMEQAERAFYSGHHQDAVKYYEQVLRFEPTWERAKEHRAQANEFMIKGYIPETRLPPEVASLFGKAQSAARVMRVKDAMEMLEMAKEILLQNGITRWNEGSQFEIQLQNAIDAEEIAKEADVLFSQGQMDEAIEKVELASGLTGYPKYKTALEQYKAFKAEIKSLHEILFIGILTLEPMLEASKKLASLLAQSPDNTALHILNARFESLKPILAEKIKQEIRSVKFRVDRSQYLDTSYSEIEKAKSLLDDVASTSLSNDSSFLSLTQDIFRIRSDIERYKTDLSRAIEAYSRNRLWPSEAWKISEDVRRHYPNDPDVLKLKKDLQGYRLKSTIIQIIIVLIILSLIIIGTQNGLSST